MANDATPRRSPTLTGALLFACVVSTIAFAQDSYVNFESSQVHPIATTPSGARVLAVNTPAALLEVFAVQVDGSLVREKVVPVGLEPVSVIARTDSEAWVANHLSDSVSIVDLEAGLVTKTLDVGDEPTDVVFAAGRAFVAVSQEDRVQVFTLANLDAAPTPIDLFGSDTRALAVSNDGSTVYAIVLHSGNQTTVVHRNIIPTNNSPFSATKLAQLGLNDMTCASTPPLYPPNPAGIVTNPALTDPPPGIPAPISLIVRWNGSLGRFEDDAGQDWTDCLPVRFPDHDLFAIDATTLAVTPVPHLGTTLFDVSVHPQNGKIYVPNTEARNEVRFEHPLGVAGHVVDNRLAVVDPSNGNAVTHVELNAHIDRGSDPSTNLAERLASISQPGMMVWEPDGSHAWLTAIGSRKLFRLDGACLDGSCVFGPTRSAPEVVEVGEGPTGVALLEARDRLYVLNRFSNEVAIVDRSARTVVDRLPMYDPSDDDVKAGRRFLYDGILSSGHGDAACSSCHVSGDLDGLGWDLGNPEGAMVPYGQAGDNVRFIAPGDAGTCPPAQCASHDGFDPRKGPMTTQSLRGMLEPLHWRGDRPTMAAFNGAFPNLLGTVDISGAGEPAKGLSDADMETFRRFALGIRYPPNPYRNLDDTIPDANVQIPGHVLVGNPTEGAAVFFTDTPAGPTACKTCHASVFGSNGGKLDGLQPGDPEIAKAGLIGGDVVVTFHNDVKVGHLRNLYEKFGPTYGTDAAPIDNKTGFGFGHDGSIPNLGTFFSASPTFQETAEQVRDVSTFVLHWPTGQKPSVGHQVTVPPGPPPTGTPDQESRIDTLVLVGDAADADRHCELTASSLVDGEPATWKFSGGMWVFAEAGAASSNLASMRSSATDPITFTCGTVGSSERLGLDWDEDGVANRDDCAPADASASALLPTTGLRPDAAERDRLNWDEAASSATYNVVSGSLSDLATTGLTGADCLAGDLGEPTYVDARADPPSGDGFYYLVQTVNGCGGGPFGPGRAPLKGTCATGP